MYQRNFQGTPKDITVAPLIPKKVNGEAKPLTLVGMDTYVMPTVGKRRNNWVAGPYEPWKMVVIIVDTLTKFSMSYPVQQNAKGRAQSGQTRDALIMFRQRMRNLANDQTLEIQRLLLDRGSEFKALFQDWIDQEQQRAGGGYEIVQKVGTKAHANGISERNVAIHRRYMMARYQAEKKKTRPRVAIRARFKLVTIISVICRCPALLLTRSTTESTLVTTKL
jgi:hypothetical protein